MSAASGADGSLAAPERDDAAQDHAAQDHGRFRAAPSLATAVLGLTALLQTGPLLRAETALSAVLARLTGAPEATASGTTVLFVVDGHVTGYTLTLACSAVFLLLPFTAVTVVLTGVSRVRARTALSALALAALVVVGANQVRIATIASAMQVLGPERGYGLTHVLVGTVVSTLGTVVAGGVYLVVLVRGQRGQRGQRTEVPRG